MKNNLNGKASSEKCWKTSEGCPSRLSWILWLWLQLSFSKKKNVQCSWWKNISITGTCYLAILAIIILKKYMLLDCHSSAGSWQPQEKGKRHLVNLMLWPTFFKYNLFNNFTITLKIRATLTWSHALYLRYLRNLWFKFTNINTIRIE